jgi:hypothetical protein
MEMRQSADLIGNFVRQFLDEVVGHDSFDSDWQRPARRTHHVLCVPRSAHVGRIDSGEQQSPRAKAEGMETYGHRSR